MITDNAEWVTLFDFLTTSSPLHNHLICWSDSSSQYHEVCCPKRQVRSFLKLHHGCFGRITDILSSQDNSPQPYILLDICAAKMPHDSGIRDRTQSLFIVAFFERPSEAPVVKSTSSINPGRFRRTDHWNRSSTDKLEHLDLCNYSSCTHAVLSYRAGRNLLLCTLALTIQNLIRI